VSRDKKDHIALSDEHNSRGIELADRGWLDEAVKEFQKAIELDPDSAHAHDNLATVYSEKKLYREALAEYLTAIRLEPESATAHYNLGVLLTSQRRYAEAAPHCAEARRLSGAAAPSPGCGIPRSGPFLCRSTASTTSRPPSAASSSWIVPAVS